MNYTPYYNKQISVEGSDEMPFPSRIETDQLLLTPIIDLDYISLEELKDIYAENSGTDKYFTSETGLPSTIEDTRGVLKFYEELQEDQTDIFYAIYDKTNNNEFIGQAVIEDVELDINRCSMGIWLKKSVWGQGVSQKRAEALLYAIFTEMDIELVEVEVVTENENSIRSVEKYISRLGGEYNGIRRRATITPTGDIYDKKYYSISKKQFFSNTSDMDVKF
jgi:RimJ/RimL family protein N-acetyltransferase